MLRFWIICSLTIGLSVSSVCRADDSYLVADKQLIPVPSIGRFDPTSVPILIYKPEGSGPFPVILFSHGRSGDADVRAALTTPILRGHVGYWLKKGFAVAALIRPGYGLDGGADRENSGAQADLGQCTKAGYLKPSIMAGVAALKAGHDWLLKQPWVRKETIVLEGQSVGGLLTVVYASENPEGVIGYINFSGGASGFPAQHTGHSCSEDQLRDAFEEAGKLTHVPNLWLYAQNDQYWGPESPKRWHELFAKAGTSKTTFVLTASIEGRDGHLLLNYGGKLWSEPTNAFIQSLGIQ